MNFRVDKEEKMNMLTIYDIPNVYIGIFLISYFFGQKDISVITPICRIQRTDSASGRRFLRMGFDFCNNEKRQNLRTNRKRN